MFCYSCTINDFGVEIFYGIIIVRGEIMFVGFVGNPCSRIYIPTNVNADSFLYLLTKKLATDKITSPRTKESLATQWLPLINIDRNVTILFNV